jgi:hypothetical protein
MKIRQRLEVLCASATNKFEMRLTECPRPVTRDEVYPTPPEQGSITSDITLEAALTIINRKFAMSGHRREPTKKVPNPPTEGANDSLLQLGLDLLLLSRSSLPLLLMQYCCLKLLFCASLHFVFSTSSPLRHFIDSGD